MRWRGDDLVMDLDEVAPWSRAPIRGQVRFVPEQRTGASFSLDAAARHRWWPIAPCGHVDVNLREPRVAFRGRGYFDANAGDEPMTAAFRDWTWSRAHTRDGRAIVTYDVRAKNGAWAARSIAFRRGAIDPVVELAPRSVGGTRWGLGRTVRGEPGFAPRIVRTLEDGPFYARSVIETRFAGETVRAMHETLSADRLARSAVSFLLGFRMRHAR